MKKPEADGDFLNELTFEPLTLKNWGLFEQLFVSGDQLCLHHVYRSSSMCEPMASQAAETFSSNVAAVVSAVSSLFRFA